MTLTEVINDLDSLSEDDCIVVQRPWSATSDALVVKLDVEGRVPRDSIPAGYDYFLEITTILDDVLIPGADSLTAAERCDLVLYYAENDAYPEWVWDRCQPHPQGD